MNRRERFFQFVKNKKNVKRILIIRDGLLGDTVFITPILRRLNYTFPDASIDVIVGKKSVDVLKYFPGIQKIIPFKYDLSIISIIKQTVFFLSLISKRYDLLIIPEVNPHYTIMGKLVVPKKIISFAQVMRNSVDYFIERPKKRAVLAEPELVLEWTESPDEDKPVLFVSDQEVKQIKSILKSYGISENDEILLFNPGSSKQNSEKDWDLNSYIPVADHFASKYGYKIIFNGIQRDKEAYEKLASGFSVKPVMLAGENTVSIRMLFALISISKLVVGVDTGTIHIATAFDIPVVCLIGFTGVDNTGPYNPDVPVHIITADMPCIPCMNSDPKPAQWDICKNIFPVECMRRITPERVITEMENILAMLNTDAGNSL